MNCESKILISDRTIALLLRNKDRSFDYNKALGFLTLHFSLISKHIEIFLQRYAAVLVSVVLVEVYQLIHHVHGLACAWFQFLSAQQIAYEHG